MNAKKLVTKAMEIEISRTRESLPTDIYTASVHYDNVKRLSGTLHLLANFEARIISSSTDTAVEVSSLRVLWPSSSS